jgi:hypothetical protein
MSYNKIIDMTNKELESEKKELEGMIDEGCYGTEDYKYYLMVLKEISKRKGI